MEHPITLPPELVQRLMRECPFICSEKREQFVATAAARWGADQELEACYYWIENYHGTDAADSLQQGRRPKPPSLRQQAYDALDTYIYGEPDPKDKERTYNTIRRALEQLND